MIRLARLWKRSWSWENLWLEYYADTTIKMTGQSKDVTRFPFKKWSFETPKSGSKCLLKWRVTKSHSQLRWTIHIHSNGIWSKNYIRECAHTQDNYRCGSKHFVRLADRFWLVHSVKIICTLFFTNVLVTPNSIIWNEKLLKMMDSAKPFAIPT